jgi:integrase
LAPCHLDRQLGEFVETYLTRHAGTVRERTIWTLRVRLRYAVAEFGDVKLRELEHMSDEIAAWAAGLPERSRYGIVSALRQTLGAAVRWHRMSSNPAKLVGRNRQPAPRTVRVFTREEIDAVAAELPPPYRALPAFTAATGLRPGEWAALERRDIDRPARVLTVARTISNGQMVELGKTEHSRRQVPLSTAALEALDLIPPRLDTPLLFPAPNGGPLNLDNFRRRFWGPAIEAAGIAKPARLYDTRSTFISGALAARISVFEIARLAGTSVGMIERHYGALLDGSGASILARLDAAPR